jgi:histidine triad (HIT) family protein
MCYNVCMNDPNCLFCQIANGDQPSHKVYEDENFLAFLDINPVHPGHTLVIPKTHSRNLLDMDEFVASALMPVVKNVAVAVKKGVEADGISVSMSNEPVAGQVIFHPHFHVIPRYANDGLTLWPQKPYEEDQAEMYAQKISSAFE